MKIIKRTILFLITGTLLACGQQESEHFDLQQAKLKWANSGVAWSEADLQSLEMGELLYRRNCSICHARDGKGDLQLGGPALDGSPLANGQKSLLIQQILQGKKGSSMPAFAKSLSDQQIASITSYLRNAWGNRSADSVTAEEVSRQR